MPLDSKLTGKLPIIGQERYPRAQGAPNSVVGRLGSHSTAELSDLVGRLYTMTPEIVPLYPACPRLVGRAVTVRTSRGDNQAVKQAVDDIQSGDVLVIDAQGFTGWCSGGYSMLRSATIGGKLAGLLVNGAYRDRTEFEIAQLPIFGITWSPATGPKLGPGQINVPVNCGGVVVHPGDTIVADGQGVVVIPAEHSEFVADRADAKAAALAAGRHSID